ncbi:MAG: hypothetical protein H6922_02815 [Pseudomonadaceae bacterium]|nr:hypothetical protein [Pseudomonadaceae bacterium]
MFLCHPPSLGVFLGAYPHNVVDRQLAHAHRSATNAAYDRTQFIAERRRMMADWGDYLDKAAGGVVVNMELRRHV